MTKLDQSWCITLRELTGVGFGVGLGVGGDVGGDVGF